MDIGFQGIVIIILGIAFIYLIYYYHYYSKIETIVSTVDNKEYEVQIKEDAQEAANLIAQIRQKLVLIVDHLVKSYPDEDRSKRMKENFRPDNIKEGIDDPKYTSYSINKGEKIVLCLRNKDGLVNINTMMFVCLHELAHVCNETIGHDAAFWDTFRWILEESINIGIYIKQKFEENPEPYCGMIINSSPLP